MENKEVQVLIFSIEGEMYGIDILSLDEVLPMLAVKPIPKGPPFLEGVINLHGQIIPILDLSKQFGYERDEYTLKTRIVLATFSSRTIGFIIDGVKEIRSLDPKNIQETTVLDDRTRFINGVAKLDTGEMAYLISLDLILDEEKLKLLSETALTEGAV